MRVSCWDPHIGGRRNAPASTSAARSARQPKVKRAKKRAGPTGQQVKLRPDAKAAAARKPKKKAKGQGKGGGPRRATEMRNGDKICAAWNEGKCSVKAESCPAGKHVCNTFTDKNKLVCAMRNHMGKDCTKSMRA